MLSDTPIPGLWRNSTNKQSADILVEINSSPPAWVQAARDLNAVKRHKPRRHGEALDSTYSVIVHGHNEFFDLQFSDGTQFVIDAIGKRLWGTCSSPLTIDDLADYFRGPVMGLVLRLRNITALHASVLNFSGRAIVLCGESAAGKSTTAAALGLRGMPVLSEDVAALEIDNGRFHVQAGHPRISLWKDSVEALLGKADALCQVSPTWEKCYLPLDGNLARFEPQRCPLGAVYLLAPRTADFDGPRIENISPREAVLKLVQNTYMNWLLDRARRAEEFAVLSQLAAQVPVRQIVPHVDPARVGALCDLISADVASLRLAGRTDLGI